MGEMELFGLWLSSVRQVKESMEEENTKQVFQALRREEFSASMSKRKSEEAERHPSVGGTCVLEKKRPRLSDQQGKSGIGAQVSMAKQPTGALVEGLEGVT